MEDWLARWRDGRIGFHEGRPNDLLVRHGARITGRRVFVPLCGKTEDLAHLAARGHDVVGVELAEDAVRAFFSEHGLTPDIAAHGALTEYRAGAVTIFAGDVFATTPALLGPLDTVYDRAALIALPPELRPRYVHHLRSLLPVGASGLVITLEYDQALMTGPPFAVLEPELRALYTGATLELLDQRPAPPGGTCSQRGVAAIERCFAVRLDGQGLPTAGSAAEG
jgi:thiopurine S-methyltransferase